MEEVKGGGAEVVYVVESVRLMVCGWGGVGVCVCVCDVCVCVCECVCV